jgi:hypothetical protein
MATDGHGGEFVPTGPTHDLGYEPDKFAVKTILVVPAAVLATMFVVFVTTTIIFGAFFSPKGIAVPPEVPSGAEHNAAPMNERFDRISSTNPKAEVLQPRLEGLQQRREYGKDGAYDKDGKPKNADPWNVVTAEMITTQPKKDGNPPRYHAEDLRPSKVPATANPKSDTAAGVTRVPVDKAIELASDPKNADWAKALPAREGAIRLEDDPRFDWDRPKESNGGNARHPAPAKPAEPKKAGDGKEPEKKEPEKK